MEGITPDTKAIHPQDITATTIIRGQYTAAEAEQTLLIDRVTNHQIVPRVLETVRSDRLKPDKEAGKKPALKIQCLTTRLEMS